MMNYTTQKPVPYDTGKVKIGSRYQPQVSYPMSSFEYRLQESMLRKNERAIAAFDLVCWIVAAVLLVWLFVVAG